MIFEIFYWMIGAFLWFVLVMMVLGVACALANAIIQEFSGMFRKREPKPYDPRTPRQKMLDYYDAGGR